MRERVLLKFFICLSFLFWGASGCVELKPPKVGPSAQDTNIAIVENPKTLIHELRHPGAALRVNSSGNDEIAVNRFAVHRAHQGPINALVVSEDGTRAFSGGSDGRVVYSVIDEAGSRDRWGAPVSRRQVRYTEPLLEGNKPILALALSPDEGLLAVSQFSLIVVVDLSARKIVHRLSRLQGGITALDWDPEGDLLAVGRANGDIYVWRLDGDSLAGADNVKALEEYGGTLAPIRKVAFHPSGRMFFIAPEGKKILLWRLLRTDRQLGLRDEESDVYRAIKGSHSARIDTSTSLEEMWIRPDAGFLFAVLREGKEIASWKVRGLVHEYSFAPASEAVKGISGVFIQTGKGRRARDIPLLVTTGRSQRVRFWCQFFESAEDKAQYIPRLDERGLPLPKTEGIVAESVLFENPLDRIVASKNSERLWITDKTGNLLTFHTKSVFKSSVHQERVANCKPQPS